MMFKKVPTLLRACALAGLVVALTSASASAATLVNFSTSLVFASSGTGVSTFGDATNNAQFTFQPTILEFDIAPSNFHLGNIVTSLTGLGYIGAGSDAFTLTIGQLLPSVGSGELIGSLDGTVAVNLTNDFVLTFSTTSVTIGNIVYTVDPSYLLVAPSSNGGLTSMQGRLTEVPEPATMMLLGTGLLAAFRARRRAV